MLWTIAFWKGAGERAIKTFFQTLTAIIGIDSSGIGATVGLGDVNWEAMVSIATTAALVSIFTSIANADFVAGKDAVAEALAKAVAEKLAELDMLELGEGLPPRAIGPDDEPDSAVEPRLPLGFHLA